MRAYKGSLTVEASLLVPLLLFMIMALIYLAFYQYDCVIMQSYGLREGERILWQEEGENTVLEIEGISEIPVMMMEVLSISENEKSILAEVVDRISCQKTVGISIESRLSAGLVGNAAFLGDELNASVSMYSIRLDYRKDRLRTIFSS